MRLLSQWQRDNYAKMIEEADHQPKTPRPPHRTCQSGFRGSILDIPKMVDDPRAANYRPR